jgi:hypothetical protein
MDTGSYLPAFLLLAPLLLAVVDLLGIRSSHSSMGLGLPRNAAIPPRAPVYGSSPV